MVRDGRLLTAPVSAGILNGITRDSVARIARDMDLEVVEATMPREMLYVADELFFTGTAAEITPIRSVDRITVGTGRPGPITLAIQEQYMGIAEGRLPRLPRLSPSSLPMRQATCRARPIPSMAGGWRDRIAAPQTRKISQFPATMLCAVPE